VDPGETCCDFGSCPSGWDCCSFGTCYPKGGECCATGDHCTGGNVCVLVDGLQRCCTDMHCTAHVSSGVTYSAYVPASNPTNTAGAGTDSPIMTTSPHAVTTEAAGYEYYYFTITWSVPNPILNLRTDNFQGITTPGTGHTRPLLHLCPRLSPSLHSLISLHTRLSRCTQQIRLLLLVRTPYPLIIQVPFKLQDKPPYLIRSVKLTTPTTDSFLGLSETFSGSTPAVATSILAETPSSSRRSTRVPTATGSSSSSSSGSATTGSRSDAESLRMGLGVGMWAGLVVGVGGLMVWL
jgi:hypothetical protein